MIQKGSSWKLNILLVKIPSNYWNDNKNLRYHMNFVCCSRFWEKWLPSLKSSTMSKMLSNNIAWYREIIHERKSKLRQQTSLCLILRNCHSHLNLQQPPPWSISSHQHWGKTLHQQKHYDLLKVQILVNT